MPKPSPDQMIKNLIRDYPVDALEFFKPEIIARYGAPVDVHINIQEVKKHSHSDRNLKNDISVTFTFGDGRKLVLVLVEHWSDKAKFDIFRFAHYLIDLACRFPGIEILPVALFTDRSERWLKPPALEIKIMCLDDTYLHFRYDLVRMKEYQAERYIETRNRFIAVLRSAMRFELEKKIALAVDFIRNYGYIENDIRIIEKNIDIIEFFLEISDGEKREIIESLEERGEAGMTIVQELKRRGFQEGIEKGIEKGIQEGIQEGILKGMLEEKRSTARAMKSEGIDMKTISRVTGLSEAEIRNIR